MGFWIFMLVMDLLTPLLMLGFGIASVKHTPKQVNSVYGYRTAMSMKNRDTWQFAHQYFGKLWTRIGLVLLPVSVVPLLFVIGESENTVGMVGGILCAVQVFILIGSVFPVEKALKRTFDADGKRKERIKNC